MINTKAPIKRLHEVYPLLLALGDISYPKTFRQVDPDNLAVSFGDGYVFKSVSFETTDELVTTERCSRCL